LLQIGGRTIPHEAFTSMLDEQQRRAADTLITPRIRGKQVPSAKQARARVRVVKRAAAAKGG
jgi:hypothetical protein